MPGQAITVVRADPQDAGRLTHIAHVAKAHWGYPEKWILSWSAELMITPEYIESHPTFAALSGKDIIGFSTLHMWPNGASLDHLWVLPTEMGKGTGRALFAHAEEIARERVRRA